MYLEMKEEKNSRLETLFELFFQIELKYIILVYAVLQSAQIAFRGAPEFMLFGVKSLK